MCVDRRYLYFFPDRKITKCLTNSYSLERKNVQKMDGLGVEKETRIKIVLPFVNG